MSDLEKSALQWSYPVKFKNHKGDWVSAGMVWKGPNHVEMQDFADLHEFLSGDPNYDGTVNTDEFTYPGTLSDEYTTTPNMVKAAKGKDTVVLG